MLKRIRHKKTHNQEVVAYFLARCGKKGHGGQPTELEVDSWKEAYQLFWPVLKGPRTREEFHNTMKGSRDIYDPYVASGRVGRRSDGIERPPAKLGRLAQLVLDEWKERSDQELYDFVSAFIKRGDRYSGWRSDKERSNTMQPIQLNSKPNSDDDSSLRSSSTHPNHGHNFNCLTPEEMQRCNAIVSETDRVFLWPTPTWLDNQSADSTEPFRELLLQKGLHNSDNQPHGKEYKEDLDVYLGFKDSVQTTIGFYRSKNKGKTKRNDRRMSFNTQVLKEFCSAGDAIAVIIESQTEDTMIKFVNLTREKIAASGIGWSITRGEVKPRKKPEYQPGSDRHIRDAEARESQLEMSFKLFLESEGRTVVTHKYHSGLECDIFDESSGVLYEAKAHAEREDVRMAIGQLFDYGYLEFLKTEVHPELAILLPQRPNKEMEELCRRLKIRVVWPVGDTFVSSTGSV